MALLNQADAIYIGGQKADAVYLGANKVWPEAVVGSTWSASDAAANGMTLSNGGLTVTQSGSGSWQSIRGTISKSSGKLYVEFSTNVAMTNINFLMLGLADASFSASGSIGATPKMKMSAGS